MLSKFDSYVYVHGKVSSMYHSKNTCDIDETIRQKANN